MFYKQKLLNLKRKNYLLNNDIKLLNYNYFILYK